jgi:hypothetical protein
VKTGQERLSLFIVVALGVSERAQVGSELEKG